MIMPAITQTKSFTTLILLLVSEDHYSVLITSFLISSQICITSLNKRNRELHWKWHNTWGMQEQIDSLYDTHQVWQCHLL